MANMYPSKKASDGGGGNIRLSTPGEWVYMSGTASGTGGISMGSGSAMLYDNAVGSLVVRTAKNYTKMKLTPSTSTYVCVFGGRDGNNAVSQISYGSLSAEKTINIGTYDNVYLMKGTTTGAITISYW